MQKEIYYKELAHTPMEADKSRIYRVGQWAGDLGGLIFQFPSHSEASLLENFSCTESFCSIRAFNWLDTDHPHGVGGAEGQDTDQSPPI